MASSGLALGWFACLIEPSFGWGLGHFGRLDLGPLCVWQSVLLEDLFQLYDDVE
jgi:hypothetical protein